MIDFDQTVYYVDFEKMEVVSDTLESLCREYAEITTSRVGVTETIHLRDAGNGKWELWTWGIRGNNPKKLEEYDTDEEASQGLLSYWKIQLDENENAPTYFFTEDEAEEHFKAFKLFVKSD